MEHVDPLLYERTPIYGVAGGPDILRLTTAGYVRVFAVANNIRLSEREYNTLSGIAACGSAGVRVSQYRHDGPSWLSARKLIELTSDGHSWVATETGRQCLTRAVEEEGRLLLRIEAERIAQEVEQ